MSGPPQFRTFHSPQIFTSLNKMPATSAKLMTLLHTLISSQICRAVRALSRAKSFLVEIVRKGQMFRLIYSRSWQGDRKGCGRTYFGSFGLHYNWRSSRSFSIPGSALDGVRPSYLQYNTAAGNVADVDEDREGEEDGSDGLSGYLWWLEEGKSDGEKLSSNGSIGGNEIDELADVFIAKCHEKFILEKQESDRRFQEMLARSM